MDIAKVDSNPDQIRLLLGVLSKDCEDEIDYEEDESDNQ